MANTLIATCKIIQWSELIKATNIYYYLNLMTKIDWPKLLGSLAITFAAGWLGSSLTAPSIHNWYSTINRTNLTPPNWLFAPVWTILFCLMAIALYLAWSGRGKKKTRHKLVISSLVS